MAASGNLLLSMATPSLDVGTTACRLGGVNNVRRVAKWRRSLGRDDWDPRIQPSFAVGLAFAATMTAAVVLSSANVRPPAALAVMAGIAALSGWIFEWSGALVTAGLAWLMLNGFVADRYGELRWHGHRDIVAAIVLTGSAAAAGALRGLQIRRRRRLELITLNTELSELTGAAHRTLGGRHA